MRMTTMMAIAAAMAPVGQKNNECGGTNVSMTMIPLTTTKMTRTKMKKGGDGIFLPPSDATQEDWQRNATNGCRQ